MKKKIFFRLPLLACAALCILCISCKKEAEPLPVTEMSENSHDHTWYAFTRSGILQCSLPQKSSIQSLMPWTENLRVSDAAVDDDGNGYMVVNRLGILTFRSDDSEKKSLSTRSSQASSPHLKSSLAGPQSVTPILVQDSQLFRDTTAGNLVFSDGQAYFTLYKSAFFNKTVTSVTTDAQIQDASNRSYLVRTDASSSMLFPVITYGDLGLSANEEVSGTYFDGSDWLVAIKRVEEDKTYFRFGSWKPAKNLMTMSPVTREGKIKFTEKSEDDFRIAQMPRPFTRAPERIKKLLKVLPDDFDFSLVVHTASGASPRQFYSGEDSGPLARALLTERAVCVIFEDGTSYFSGAISGRELVSNGATLAFRLPKLPESYYYTDFILTGDYLVIGWEESDFYKTGRSGILMVDLAKIFYGKDADRQAGPQGGSK